MNRKIGTIVILILIGIFVYSGFRYFAFRSKNAVSEAAFIKSDRLANLTFKVGGNVTNMFKKENEEVKKGELLATIDPTDLKVMKKKLIYTIKSLEKSLEATILKKSRLKESLSLKTSIAGSDIKAIDMKLQSLKYRIDATKTKLRKLDKDVGRYEQMWKRRLISASDFETIQTKRSILLDEVKGMQKEYRSLEASRKGLLDAYRLSRITEKKIKELEKSIVAKKEELKSYKEAVLDIENRIGYTRLYAPFNGVIAKKYIEAPRVVKSGSMIYALLDPSSLYCEVLLSEKKMHGVKPGNRVTVTVDAAKDRKIEGRVESIAPTSASTFSLVPRDIASGEFTKLDQRFKIRISMSDTKDLRVGMSAHVAIERR